VALGVAIVGAVAAIDAGAGGRAVVIGSVLLAPFVVSMVSGARETAIVGGVAIVAAALSGTWNDDFGDATFVFQLALVVVGSAVALLAARSRTRSDVNRRRFRLLAGIAEVSDGRLTLEETADRAATVIVRDFADACLIDVLEGEGVRRLSAQATPATAGYVVEQLRVSPTACLPAGAALLEPNGLTVPLRARGHHFGALTLLAWAASPRRYTEDDLAFAEVLAGRVSLALDAAGLSQVLQATEAQLTTALGSLAEAVTIQDASGALVFANDAAVALLGFESEDELLATPPKAIAERFDSFTADGAPLDMAQIPGRRIVMGEADPEPLEVRVIDKRSGEERWRLLKASAVRDPSGKLELVVNIIADITAAKRSELAHRLLARAGEALASSLDYQGTLQQVAELAVPELADWCAVSLPDERGQLSTVAVAHADADMVSLARDYGARYPVSITEEQGAARVFREGEPLCVNEVTDEMLVEGAHDEEHLRMLRGLGMRAALVLPVESGGRTLGVLSLVTAESGRSFSDDDVKLASELARRAGTAVEHSRLYHERSHIARTLQMSLMPDDLPPVDGWRTATLYRPAGDENWVGGDFYDAITLPDGELFLVGDVTGRGAEAAALTGLMRNTLRTAASLTGSAPQALHALNRELCRRPHLSLCTAVCIVLRESGGRSEAEIFCAGHPLPLLIRGGEAQFVGGFGTLLGAFDEAEWTATVVPIEPGDTLVLYSDGVLDTVGAEGRFGADRLAASASGDGGAHEIVARIDAALRAFEVGEQADDTAVVAIERVGVPAGDGLVLTVDERT
jgi:PAS domain S-box-containing protein